MARKKIIYFDYVYENVISIIDKFDIKHIGNIVTTFFDNRVLATIEVSIKYLSFDFRNFAKNIVENIEKYFTPQQYCLRINKGYQEIRLVGEEIIIGEDKYQKMFSIVNSSDKTRALRMNIGLIRGNTNTPCVIAVDNENASVYGKHYIKSLPDKIKDFTEVLPEFNIIIEKQVASIYSLYQKEISVRALYEKLLHYDELGVVIACDVLRLRMLTKMIVKSGLFNNLSKEEIQLMNYPTDFVKSNFDFNINAKIVFDLYTEIYKNYDSTVIERETRKIYSAIMA